MIERVILVHSDRGRVVDGIRDYSRRLGEELPRHAIGVEHRTSLRDLPRAGSEAAIVLQYSPFCFARWGFAPWLPAWLLAIRAGADRPTMAIMVHEPYVPIDSWRSASMGLWQRLQLAALRFAVDVVFTSIDTWAERFSRQLPSREVRHLPVGSNFPDARSRRREERQRLGVDEETLVVACMGREHPSWLGEYVVGAVNAIAATGRPLALLCMGAEAPRPSGLDPSVAVHAPGYLDPEELAGKLAASDLFLAPLLDGVSTRRGTLMAALQHGLPAVGTAGPLTDAVLREADSALRLTPVGSAERFAAEAARLAADPGARASTGAAARLLYERRFDWPVIAGELLAALPDR